MKLLDSRRYTGPNVVWRHPGAVLDIQCTPEQASRLVPAWTQVARQLLDAVGWHGQEVAGHHFSNGVALALSAPVDALYAAVELAESAYDIASISPPLGEDHDGEAGTGNGQGAAHPLEEEDHDGAAGTSRGRRAAHPLEEDHDGKAGTSMGRRAAHPLEEDHDGKAGTSNGQPPAATDLATATVRLRELIAEEVNPALLALRDAARARGVAFLSDDDEASAGQGRGSKVWPVKSLPAPDQVPWSQLHNIPVGLVTGTNGKTTSVRMATAIARAAGKNAGFSSTDWVGVNDDIVARGDYSGPGGARAVLRHPQVDIAILETARGGLLRRGLGVEHADAALITTIAEDHLGDFGSGNLPELLEIKWVVTRALDKTSYLVLNADDALLVDRATQAEFPVIWFALDPANPTLAAHCRQGGQAMSVVEGSLAHFDGAGWHELCKVDDIPLTMKGAARYNTANALGAAGLTLALGMDYASIVTGLCSMTAADNPGRGNLFHIGGVDVLIDFAHNPQAIGAILELASQRPACRRLLAFSQAGDRTDTQIRELAQVAWQVGLDRVIVSELAQYYRGRKPGEVFAILRDELLRCGAQPGQIQHYETELESLQAALDWAQSGDLVIVLALAEARRLLDHLSLQSAT